MSKIEERITEVTQHGILFEFLGADNIERLKTEIVDAIVEQVKSDLRDNYDFIINPYELVEDIIDKAKQEVEEKLKKKFKNAMLEYAEKCVDEWIGKGSEEKWVD